MLTLAVALMIFIVTLLVIFNWKKHTYWKSKGISTPPYLPLIGHLHKYFGLRWEKIDLMYQMFKSHGCWGIYESFNPVLFISDPKIIRDVCIKDSDHFIDRRPFPFCGKEDYLAEMLFALNGEKWKELRSLMTPTFTSGKIKAMFPLITSKGDGFIVECKRQMTQNSFVNIHSIEGYFTLDAIASCAFGIDAKCLETKEDSDFVQNSRNIFSADFLGTIKLAIMNVSPWLYKVLGLQIGSNCDFLAAVIEKTVEIRKKSGIRRGDFLDLLMDILEESNKSSDKKYPMTMKIVISQSILFILTGFDTTGSGLGLTTYLLAQNPDKQEKLRKELQDIIEVDGEFTYQSIMEAHYLDACISEGMRVYPPAHYIERLCNKSYKIDGLDLKIPDGMNVAVPVWSLHHDPDYWEDPQSFTPERFMPENKANIKPYTYMPFGLGPRNCIGMRFALLTSKIGLAKLCLNFELSVRAGFEKVKLESFIDSLRPDENGIQLVLKKIQH